MLPRFLGMAPLVDDSEMTTEVNGVRERRRSSFGLMQRAEEYVLKQPRSEMMFDKQRERHGLTRSIGREKTSDSSLRSYLTFLYMHLVYFNLVAIKLIHSIKVSLIL